MYNQTDTPPPTQSSVSPDTFCPFTDLLNKMFAVGYNRIKDGAGSANNFKHYSCFVIGCLALPLNIVLVAIIGFLLRRRRLEWKRFYLVLNTSIVDILSAITICSSSFIHILSLNLDPASSISTYLPIWMRLWDGLEHVVIHIPAINYGCQAILQFVAVRFPIVYRTKVTVRITVLVIIFDWIIMTSLSLIYFMSYHFSNQDNGLLTQKFSVGYATCHILMLITLIVLILAVFICAMYQTVHPFPKSIDSPTPKSRDCKKTCYRLIRNMMPHVMMYIFAAGIVFISQLILDIETVRNMNMKVYDENYEYVYCDSIDPHAQWMINVLYIETIIAIATPIWLARLIIDPLQHLIGNEPIRRTLCCRPIKGHDRKISTRSTISWPFSSMATSFRSNHRQRTISTASGVSSASSRVPITPTETRCITFPPVAPASPSDGHNMHSIAIAEVGPCSASTGDGHGDTDPVAEVPLPSRTSSTVRFQ